MAECPEDEDLLDMATEELNQAVEEEKKLQSLLLKSLLPKDDMLMRGAHFGCESCCDQLSSKELLFSQSCIRILLERPSLSELRQRYERYSQKKGWKFDVIDVTESDLRGYKEASAAISGASVYGKLKFEKITNNVREKSGRVHTSAVSVTILPQADEVDVQLRNEDLRIDTYRSGGSGGQHANTTNNAVRITHIPTGMIVSTQDERSQHMNKAKALKLLCAKLYEMERTKKRSYHCKLTVSDDRSELVRTYNFPQGRVMDCRVSITHHAINDVMQGENIDIFIDALLYRRKWMQLPHSVLVSDAGEEGLYPGPNFDHIFEWC
ncbi:hypothetical protein Patl1_19387 [Pistacia atlantica]|uniref:Uncharacterized protein n=1 Tax=Pistacia atlantica TaxID=434234 RepID=A0ACC1C0F0_9ROSI|nr:hypothetical protein Patl1_19387 [Pistacia atlantica]